MIGKVQYIMALIGEVTYSHSELHQIMIQQANVKMDTIIANESIINFPKISFEMSMQEAIQEYYRRDGIFTR